MTSHEHDIAIVAEALKAIPKAARDEFSGIAWIKLNEIRDRSPADQIRAIASHLRYHHRRAHQTPYAELSQDPEADAPAVDLVELRDELARLDPLDQAIAAMILTGHPQAAIAHEVHLSPAALFRRLQELRRNALRIDTLGKSTTAPPLATDTARMVRRHRDRTTHRHIIAAYRAAHPLCERCLREAHTCPTAEIHHIRPVAEGGATSDDNLLALCAPCHNTINLMPRHVQRMLKETP